MTISKGGPQFTGLAADDSRPEGDRIRKVVHALLAIYLLPALALVLVVGGGLMAVSMVVRGVAGVVGFAKAVPEAAATVDQPGLEWASGAFVSSAKRVGRRPAAAQNRQA